MRLRKISWHITWCFRIDWLDLKLLLEMKQFIEIAAKQFGSIAWSKSWHNSHQFLVHYFVQKQKVDLNKNLNLLVMIMSIKKLYKWRPTGVWVFPHRKNSKISELFFKMFSNNFMKKYEAWQLIQLFKENILYPISLRRNRKKCWPLNRICHIFLTVDPVAKSSTLNQAWK